MTFPPNEVGPADPQEVSGEPGGEMADDDLPRTVHDALFKSVFGAPPQAAAMLSCILPSQVARHMDWSTLTPVRASAVSDKLKQNHGDLWFRVGLRSGRSAFLWVLFEHQSSPDRWMALRFQEVAAKLLTEWHDRNPDKPFVPAIVPVVLYQGARPWTEPTSLVELYDLSDEERADLAGYVPSCGFVLDDLRVTGDRDIDARPLDPVARLTLIAMKYATDPALPAKLDEHKKDILMLVAGESGKKQWIVLLRYIWYCNPYVNLDELEKTLAPAITPEVKADMLTYPQQMEKQGFDRGIDIGVERGIDIGVEKGQRAVLRRQLERRFGALPAWVTERIARASSAELEPWTERILDADSLDAVFNP